MANNAMHRKNQHTFRCAGRGKLCQVGLIIPDLDAKEFELLCELCPKGTKVEVKNPASGA